MKELVAREIAMRARSGETIGVGSGTTVDLAIDQIGRRVREEGMQIRVVPSSYQSARRCEAAGLAVLHPACCDALHWGFDGADAVDPQRRLIKGRGGAMLQEKILAARCRDYVIIIDESKLVENLGGTCPVPVEVIPEALAVAEKGLLSLGASSLKLRQGTACERTVPMISQAGNLIIDAHFDNIAETLERDIKAVVGVVENGLFIGYASEVLIATSQGIKTLP